MSENPYQPPTESSDDQTTGALQGSRWHVARCPYCKSPLGRAHAFKAHRLRCPQCDRAIRAEPILDFATSMIPGIVLAVGFGFHLAGLLSVLSLVLFTIASFGVGIGLFPYITPYVRDPRRE